MWHRAYSVTILVNFVVYFLVIWNIQANIQLDPNIAIFSNITYDFDVTLPHKHHTTLHHLFHIGVHNPEALVDILLYSDPLGSKVKNIRDFQCDSSTLLPNHVDESRLQAFRENKTGTYLFVQHIRKAGGSGLFDLGERNHGNTSMPPPDGQGYWHGSLGSAQNMNYTKFRAYMTDNSYRLAMNEWDRFFDFFFEYEGAVMTTELRDPLTRWYSQYVFEHLEYRCLASTPCHHERGDLNDPFMIWYSHAVRETTGKHYYIKSFIGQDFSSELRQQLGSCPSDLHWYWSYQVLLDTPITWALFHRAIKTLSHFPILLIMEFINQPETIAYLARELGWTLPPTIYRPNRREDYHVDYATLPALEQAITHDEYRYISRENVLDMLFYQVARKMFMERVKCYR